MNILLILFLLKQTKTVKLIGYILAIPLLPLSIIAILSQIKPLARLTLPMTVFPLIARLIYHSISLLVLLHPGNQFESNVIPYLILTAIMISSAYFDNLV